MKGSLLSFNTAESKGAISGEDGNRYTFQGAEWKEEIAPQKGQNIDFVVSRGEATGIYLESIVSGNKKDDSWYKSSDSKLLAGVCSGLADKFDVSILGFRIVTALLSIFTFFPIIAYIVLCLLLPAKKTEV